MLSLNKIHPGRTGLLTGLLTGMALGLAAFASPAVADSHEKDASEFIQVMANQAVKALTDRSISRQQRIERFRRIFKEHFAVKPIGKWILGRHWRRATAEERQAYLALFEDLIVISYVDRFAQYTGETLTISKTLAHNEKTVTVFSQIAHSGGGGPVRIDWRVGGGYGAYKVLDVTVEGLSMSTTLKSDFSSIIRREGGKVAGLLEALRQKTSSLRPTAVN